LIHNNLILQRWVNWVNHATLLPTKEGIEANTRDLNCGRKCVKIWSTSNEKDIQWMRTTLADLKAKVEGADQRH
jgi:hypothetical protein